MLTVVLAHHRMATRPSGCFSLDGREKRAAKPWRTATIRPSRRCGLGVELVTMIPRVVQHSWLQTSPMADHPPGPMPLVDEPRRRQHRRNAE